MPEEAYTLQIDLNALRHLGIGLYSSLPAAVSEAVSNAWDADATRVDVEIDTAAGTITISDDGHGMTQADANAFYLNVGYARRDDGRKYSDVVKRRVMGRKGIGKLALFSVARVIEVQSVKDPGMDSEARCGFRMRLDDIEDAIKAKLACHPVPVDPSAIVINMGTRIVLSDLKKKPNLTANYLRQRLARRFGVIGAINRFEVYVNGEPISPEDRGYLNKVQYLWSIGSDEHPPSGAIRREVLLGDIDSSRSWKLTGWVGTVDERKSLDEGDNAIIVLARGKLVHEDLLSSLGEGGVFSKYVIGELHAEFLDIDDDDDIATSDRQSLDEDSERFRVLRDFVRDAVLKRIESRWTQWRNEDSEKVARENPAIDRWFHGLSSGRRKYAQQLFRKISTLRLANEKERQELYRQGILAFERMAMKEQLELIEQLQSEDALNTIIAAFGVEDELEAVQYYDIARGRLAVIRQFDKLAPEAQEKVLQQFLFERLWLLDPAWDRATDDPKMEESVAKEFAGIPLSDEEENGRIDIRYKQTAGKHVVVELKKYDVATNVHDLAKQISKYVRGLEKCLRDTYQISSPSIEAVCVLGSAPSPKEEYDRNQETLRVQSARFITYDALIKNALQQYGEYLDRQREIQRLVQLVESI